MKRALVVALILLAGIVSGWIMRSVIARDSCLDHGGVWISAGGVCTGLKTELVITRG
jgi:hypothetical protein